MKIALAVVLLAAGFAALLHHSLVGPLLLAAVTVLAYDIDSHDTRGHRRG